MGIKRVPYNIQRGGYPFQAKPNIPVFISITDIYIIGRIWRKIDCGWVDATGDYDLCMNEDRTRWKFVNVRDTTETFLYEYIPGNWFAKRSGYQKP